MAGKSTIKPLTEIGRKKYEAKLKVMMDSGLRGGPDYCQDLWQEERIYLYWDVPYVENCSFGAERVGTIPYRF